MTGEILHWFGSSTDIHDRHTFQSGLADDRARFASFIEHLPIGVCLIDRAGRQEISNSSFRRYLPGEPMPSRMQGPGAARWRAWDATGRLLAPDEYPGARAQRGELAVPGDDFLYRDEDGREVWTNVRGVPLRNNDGEVTGFAAMILDIDAQKRAQDDLRASEQHLDALVRGSSNARFSMSADWGELRQLAGHGFIADTTSVDRDWLGAYVPAEDRDLVRAEIARVLDTLTPYELEHRVNRVDGTTGWAHSRAVPLIDGTGVLTGWMGSATDVTSRRRGEERRGALLALNARLRDLGDPAEMAFAAAEILGTTLDAARAGYATIHGADLVIERDWAAPGHRSGEGRHPVAMFGTPVLELRHGLPFVVTDISRDPRITDGERAGFEAFAIRALVNQPSFENGAFVAFFYVNASTPRGWSDEDLAFVQSVTDLTRTAIERRRAERGLHELAASLERQVSERTAERDRSWRLSQELLVVAAPDGTLEAVNPAWPALLGWSERELLGSRFIDYTHPDDLAATLAAFTGIFEKPLVAPYEYRFRHKDGSYRWFAWTGSFEHGRVYASGRHTTVERDQAEALRQSQKMEAVGQLTGGLAHDFNNLLAGISGSLELMQTRMRQGRLADVDKYMMAAQGASKRAAALTHRLLAFSRRQTLDPKPTDVNRLIGGMQEMIQRTVGPGIQVEVVGASGVWPALVDPSQLENALLNLCINSRDAMPEGGRITVETANRWMDERAARQHDMPEGQYSTLSVTDTGTGMPPEVIARVFEPFFSTKPIGEGTGLGLSMIYGFAQQSGGQVRVYSEVGQGTTVSVYLPRHCGEVADAEGATGTAELARSEEGETVLVVDDEPTVRMLVCDILEDLGYTAIEAGDSAAGLKVLQSDKRLDLLVTDVGLPGGMNGRQMADAARISRPDLKVLFITGYAENAVLGNGQLAPGMAVLTKPFAIETMASRIRSMIEAER